MIEFLNNYLRYPRIINMKMKTSAKSVGTMVVMVITARSSKKTPKMKLVMEKTK